MKKRILLVNTNKAVCSIHEFGKIAYNSLRDNDNWDIDYVETRQIDLNAFYNGKIIIDGANRIPYDVYLFNYHEVMARFENVNCNNFLAGFGIKLAFIMEMHENNPIARSMYSSNKFDGYIVIDPTMVYPDSRYHAFHKPMLKSNIPIIHQQNKIPMIGSYGLGFDVSKGFESIIEAVNLEFDQAIIRINLPEFTYSPTDNHPREFLNFKQRCESIAKPGIELRITRYLFTNDELIRWCGQHDLNAFFYDRDFAGLTSAADQAIVSGRPVAISDCRPAFRHMMQYQLPYPKQKLKETILNGDISVNAMNNDWSVERFQMKFLRLLEKLSIM